MFTEWATDLVCARPELNFTGGAATLVSLQRDDSTKGNRFRFDGIEPQADGIQRVTTAIVHVDDEALFDDDTPKPLIPGQFTYNKGRRRMFYAAILLTKDEENSV